MKPRKLTCKTIPATDPNRAYRFWRDVFDLPQTGPANARQLRLDGDIVTFVQAPPTDTLELLVRDYAGPLRQHLANNFVTILSENDRFGNKIAFTIHDSEKNSVTIEANR